ncbi:1286_t:CDS:2, partial [Ambispora leptoticha]
LHRVRLGTESYTLMFLRILRNLLRSLFARAINFTFEERISFTAQLMKKILGSTNNKLNYPEWVRAMDAFKRASVVYKAKNGKPPVIVYDNISRLVHKNPEILDILQDDAKDNADDSKYIAVFVSSEGSVPRRMVSRSAWSRADKPVIEIGDLGEKESIDYLVNKRKINSVDAKKLYELVGGRIVDLKSVAGKFLAGQSLEIIKQQILTEVKKKFDSANLLRNQSHHEAGKGVISALLDSKEIDTDVFREFFKGEKYNEVLEANVFAYHPSRDTITFQSRSVEYYIQENAKHALSIIILSKIILNWFQISEVISENDRWLESEEASGEMALRLKVAFNFIKSGIMIGKLGGESGITIGKNFTKCRITCRRVGIMLDVDALLGDAWRSPKMERFPKQQAMSSINLDGKGPEIARTFYVSETLAPLLQRNGQRPTLYVGEMC